MGPMGRRPHKTQDSMEKTHSMHLPARGCPGAPWFPDPCIHTVPWLSPGTDWHPRTTPGKCLVSLRSQHAVFRSLQHRPTLEGETQLLASVGRDPICSRKVWGGSPLHSGGFSRGIQRCPVHESGPPLGCTDARDGWGCRKGPGLDTRFVDPSGPTCYLAEDTTGGRRSGNETQIGRRREQNPKPGQLQREHLQVTESL